MRTRTLITLLAVAVLCFMTPMMQAQTATTGQITGVVTDPSGAVVIGAKVALTSDAGVRRETQSGSNGRYAFPLLDPGAYRLEVSSSGFAPSNLQASLSIDEHGHRYCSQGGRHSDHGFGHGRSAAGADGNLDPRHGHR